MQETPTTAVGVPVVPAEPVGRREEVLCCGAWFNHVEKRGDYAVLHRGSGILGVMVDRAFIEKAAMALGIALARPAHRVACGWCRVEMSPGIEPTSHGICAACEGRLFPRPAATAELGLEIKQ